MIYLKHDETGMVNLVHHMPFHEKHGLGKSKEELEQEGILVDSIPESEQIEGKSATLYCNPDTKELWYEYEDISKTPEEEQQEEIETLKQQSATQQMLLDDLLINVIPMLTGGEM